MYVCVCVLIK